MIDLSTPTTLQRAHATGDTERDTSRTAISRVRARAYLLLRVTLGVNIAVHGIMRLRDLDAFAEGLTQRFSQSPLPDVLVYAFGTALPPIELAVGLAILLGLHSELALLVGASLMAVLTLGAGLIQDYSAMGTQLIYAVGYFVLLWAIPHNQYALDAYRRRRTSED